MAQEQSKFQRPDSSIYQYFSSLYLNFTNVAINSDLHGMFVVTLFTMGTDKYQSYILFDNNGKKIAFGHEAQDQFTMLNHKQRPKYYYFEHTSACSSIA